MKMKREIITHILYTYLNGICTSNVHSSFDWLSMNIITLKIDIKLIEWDEKNQLQAIHSNDGNRENYNSI